MSTNFYWFDNCFVSNATARFVYQFYYEIPSIDYNIYGIFQRHHKESNSNIVVLFGNTLDLLHMFTMRLYYYPIDIIIVRPYSTWRQTNIFLIYWNMYRIDCMDLTIHITQQIRVFSNYVIR